MQGGCFGEESAGKFGQDGGQAAAPAPRHVSPKRNNAGGGASIRQGVESRHGIMVG